jgi:hypothetical protein
MASLKAGDVVLVRKLDRLGRSTRELLELIERIGKAGTAFRSLGIRSGRRPPHRAAALDTFGGTGKSCTTTWRPFLSAP